MKVALLLSGQFRDAKLCYPSIKEFLLNTLNPDVFISTWTDSKNIVPSSWFGATPQDDSNIDEILEMYAPISFQADCFAEFSKQFLEREARLLDSRIDQDLQTKTLNVLSMWYKKFSSNKQREEWETKNSFRYDVVIGSRFDLQFLENPNIQKINEGIIKIPHGFDWCDGVGDLFVYGDSSTMSKYYDLYEKMHYYRLAENISPTPEIIHKHHIERCGFTLERWILRYQLRGVNVWENTVTKI